jgi:hypothetical protein
MQSFVLQSVVIVIVVRLNVTGKSIMLSVIILCVFTHCVVMKYDIMLSIRKEFLSRINQVNY